ncbi:hypothetical protein U91I_01298 [alpha proteobacterium U9-1i]|nr:hypothetical protein U91I_01298 [alpha proteobacterium U9-1i]
MTTGATLRKTSLRRLSLRRCLRNAAERNDYAPHGSNVPSNTEAVA